MNKVIENFHQTLLDVFDLMHNHFFGSQFIQNLTFKKSGINIYGRHYNGREIYFFLFHGLVEDFLKITSSSEEFPPNTTMYFQPGISEENGDIWIKPLHIVPAVFSDGSKKDYPCMYYYLLPIQNAKNEFLEFMSYDFLIANNLTLQALAEICAIMLCSHEIRHEIQLSQNITIRKKFPQQLSFVNMDKFNDFISGVLDFNKNNSNYREWLEREKDACITQAYVIDAWMRYGLCPIEEKMNKVKKIILL